MDFEMTVESFFFMFLFDLVYFFSLKKKNPVFI
jgi:hypothetical protein